FARVVVRVDPHVAVDGRLRPPRRDGLARIRGGHTASLAIPASRRHPISSGRRYALNRKSFSPAQKVAGLGSRAVRTLTSCPAATIGPARRSTQAGPDGSGAAGQA